MGQTTETIMGEKKKKKTETILAGQTAETRLYALVAVSFSIVSWRDRQISANPPVTGPRCPAPPPLVAFFRHVG